MAYQFGIDDLRFAFPALFMDLADLANARNIEPAKLQRGLGLLEMSVCDVDEDVITLSAKALLDIVQANTLLPTDIGRIYVGTESSIDGSKPIASYLLGILAQYYVQHGYTEKDLFHVDVVDMTFACIGAIDAMHNSLAWLHTEPTKKAIVIAADIANYDLDSSGEYTQGAGAAAVLLSADPSLMVIDTQVGVSAACVHDFFKPLRAYTSKEVQIKNEEDQLVNIHKETPVFDGPLSNQTYQNRIEEALLNYSNKSGTKVDLDNYSGFIFHLPYAYHGRRIFDQIFLQDLKTKGQLAGFYQSLSVEMPSSDMAKDEYKLAKRVFAKAIVKSPEYSTLVQNKIERSERYSSKVGNVYTASIFLALMSHLHFSREEKQNQNKLLFFAYGSGSKSKVFQATLVDGWENKVASWTIAKDIQEREQIDFDSYVNIRLHNTLEPVSQKESMVIMDHSGILETNRYSRNYMLKNGY